MSRSSMTKVPSRVHSLVPETSLTSSRVSDLSLSRTATSASTNSITSHYSTLDSNWLPNTAIVNQPRIKISLTLSPKEIDLLKSSWSKVISSSPTGSETSRINTPSSIPSATGSLRGTPQKQTRSINIGTTNSGSSFASSLFCVQLYENFIARDPMIEKLIPSIKHQASAFAGVINVAMSTLDDLSRMNESLESLGRLHSRILGIEPEYFQTMGEVLIKTFRDRFSNDMADGFSLETEEAWIKLYCFLANSIIQGGIDPVINYESPAAEQDSVTSSKIKKKQSVTSLDSLSGSTLASNSLSSPKKSHNIPKQSYLNVTKRKLQRSGNSKTGAKSNADCMIM
ncbi:hypothetical protein KL932_005357 [Ogataea haglerorum]|nr:hypothetical protein KL915_005333 [Ogataea haglerorum]KAG7732794.1 hypothetical protein KL932_005357 [Ogataea haglerorum]KAG7735761.1 hypothetical protein KL923_005348 [Ogataea haglerorum]KAG7756749.1 hypothetical protein KL947_003469 [Ogataea haglerorum]KAG7805337.1 hypothetical protein KL924_004754 [Ogataea haglerorum]